MLDGEKIRVSRQDFKTSRSLGFSFLDFWGFYSEVQMAHLPSILLEGLPLNAAQDIKFDIPKTDRRHDPVHRLLFFLSRGKFLGGTYILVLRSTWAFFVSITCIVAMVEFFFGDFKFVYKYYCSSTDRDPDIPT